MRASMREKQENVRTQIRRQDMEKKFREKRMIFTFQKLENMSHNPEQLDQFIASLMDTSKQIYNHHLPDRLFELEEAFNNLKIIILQGQAINSLVYEMFRNDFISFLLLFLDEKFDSFTELQQKAAMILANFFGVITKDSKYYFDAYIPMLNVLGEVIVRAFARFLFAKHNKQLVQCAMYALGNLIYDSANIIEIIQKVVGFEVLLKVTIYTEQVLWITDVLSERRNNFNTQELEIIINLIDDSLEVDKPEIIMSCISTLRNLTSYAYDGLSKIMLMRNLGRVFEFTKKNDQLQLFSLQIITSFTAVDDGEDLRAFIKKYNLIDLLVTHLSSFKMDVRLEVLHGLGTLSAKSQTYAAAIANQDNFVEKLISLASGNEAKLIISALDTISQMVKHGDVELSQKFIDKNLFQVINKTLNFLHDKILMYTIEILHSVLISINYYEPNLDVKGDNVVRSQVYILGLFNGHQIGNKMMEVYNQIKNPEIQGMIDQCFDIIEQTQAQVENY